MINKSLAIKNKLYLFLSLVFSFLLFLYLTYFLFNGERGIISYYKIKNQQLNYALELKQLQKKNKHLLDKIARLQTNTLDLDYLDEKLRKNGLILENEIFINIEN